MPRLRIIIIVFILLLAGGITTIAIAAVCAVTPTQRPLKSQFEEAPWPAFVADPPAQPAMSGEIRGIGIDTIDWIASTNSSGTWVIYKRSTVGLPFRCFSGEWGWESDPKAGHTWLHWRTAIVNPTNFTRSDAYYAEVLPYGPIWPALIANTLIYAAALFALTAALRTGVRRARVKLRLRRGRCIACGYAVRALPTCPECGQIRPE